ncbi:hypothetical protein D0T50_11540 [Bacteroides sp. 214]|nr:hypothetical protein [Bacteroides sp. 214]NDW13522.1 hypothetical protein [Bacteroides sp. 214]
MNRQFRQLDDATKLRISQRLRGRSMTDSHKQAISDSMRAYWETIPNKPENNNKSINQDNNETGMQKESNN